MGIVKTGWEREKRVHFNDITKNYDMIRWDYPKELFGDALAYSRKTDSNKAIEIGPGTGKATTPFLEAGYTLTAVEMSENMTEFLISKYINSSSFSVINSTFEDVELEENSYDLIYAASSFHWVDATIGCPKVQRLLKKDGAFVLFRNNAVPYEDELHYEVQKIYDEYYYSYYTRQDRPIKISMMSYEDFFKPSEINRGFRFDSLEDYGFSDVKMKLYTTTNTYTADSYISLLETYSDHRSLPKENRELLYIGIKEAINRHGGYQKLNCIFQLYMGRKQ